MDTNLNREINNIQRQVQGMIESWCKFNGLGAKVHIHLNEGWPEKKVEVTIHHHPEIKSNFRVEGEAPNHKFIPRPPEETKADNL
jgi:hypothetical protein